MMRPLVNLGVFLSYVFCCFPPCVVETQKLETWESAWASSTEEEIIELVKQGALDHSLVAGDGLPQLHKAAGRGYCGLCKFLIDDKKCDVTVKAKEGRTLLHYAALGGNIELVTYLIEVKKLDIEAKDSIKQPPLHNAAVRGHFEVVKFLIEKGANINAQDREGDGVLHNAACGNDPELIAYLVKDKKLDVNVRDFKEKTPLHYAAALGKLKAIEAFLANGAELEARMEGGSTPLLRAVFRRQREVVKLLLKHGADINAKDNRGRGFLHIAVDNDDVELINYILTEKKLDVDTKDFWCSRGNDSYKLRALRPLVQPDAYFDEADIRECAGKNRALARLLIEKYADSSLAKNERVQQALLSIAACIMRDLDLLTLLIKGKGFDVNARDADGYTVLHKLACRDVIYQSLDEKVMVHLIKNGALVDAKTNLGSTPLRLALLWNKKSRRYLARQLIENGATIDMKNECERTVVHLFASGNHFADFIKFLINEKKLDVNAKRKSDGATPLVCAAIEGQSDVLEALIAVGAQLEVADDNGFTPLLVAVMHGRYGAVKLLLGHGADIAAKTKKQEGILHCAARGGFTGPIAWLIDEKKFDLNLKDVDGWTPLFFAIWRGQSPAVKLLLQKGALVQLKSATGRTPFNVALINGRLEIFKILTESGFDCNLKGIPAGEIVRLAASSGNAQLVKYLVEGRKLPFDEPDAEGSTPLSIAVEQNAYELVKFFIRRGANVRTMRLPNKKNKSMKLVECVRTAQCLSELASLPGVYTRAFRCTADLALALSLAHRASLGFVKALFKWIVSQKRWGGIPSDWCRERVKKSPWFLYQLAKQAEANGTQAGMDILTELVAQTDAGKDQAHYQAVCALRLPASLQRVLYDKEFAVLYKAKGLAKIGEVCASMAGAKKRLCGASNFDYQRQLCAVAGLSKPAGKRAGLTDMKVIFT
ncbi:MAG: ankyrin repeat domain-containing protein [Candidatus Dependentiae bacterium]|nr:ankyrin repeat domain-containing protein [Candidatus Dependentiae bacterium]